MEAKTVISKKNFSVPEILKYKFLVRELNSIRKSLSFQTRDYDIWHPGVFGLVNYQQI